MALNLLLLTISTAAEVGPPRLVRIMRDQGHFKRVMRHQESGSDHFNLILKDPGHFNRLMKDQHDTVKDASDKQDHGRAPELFYRVMRDQDHFNRFMRDQDHFNRVMGDQDHFNRVMRDPDHFNRVMRDQDTFMKDPATIYRVMRYTNPFDRVMRSSRTFDRVMRNIRDPRDKRVLQLQDPPSFMSARDHRHADYTRIMKRGKYSYEKTPNLSERPLGRLSSGTQKERPYSFLRYLREDSPKADYSLARLM